MLFFVKKCFYSEANFHINWKTVDLYFCSKGWLNLLFLLMSTLGNHTVWAAPVSPDKGTEEASTSTTPTQNKETIAPNADAQKNNFKIPKPLTGLDSFRPSKVAKYKKAKKRSSDTIENAINSLPKELEDAKKEMLSAKQVKQLVVSEIQTRLGITPDNGGEAEAAQTSSSPVSLTTTIHTLVQSHISTLQTEFDRHSQSLEAFNANIKEHTEKALTTLTHQQDEGIKQLKTEIENGTKQHTEAIERLKNETENGTTRIEQAAQRQIGLIEESTQRQVDLIEKTYQSQLANFSTAIDELIKNKLSQLPLEQTKTVVTKTVEPSVSDPMTKQKPGPSKNLLEYPLKLIVGKKVICDTEDPDTQQDGFARYAFNTPPLFSVKHSKKDQFKLKKIKEPNGNTAIEYQCTKKQTNEPLVLRYKKPIQRNSLHNQDYILTTIEYVCEEPDTPIDFTLYNQNGEVIECEKLHNISSDKEAGTFTSISWKSVGTLSAIEHIVPEFSFSLDEKKAATVQHMGVYFCHNDPQEDFKDIQAARTAANTLQDHETPLNTYYVGWSGKLINSNIKIPLTSLESVQQNPDQWQVTILVSDKIVASFSAKEFIVDGLSDQCVIYNPGVVAMNVNGWLQAKYYVTFVKKLTFS